MPSFAEIVAQQDESIASPDGGITAQLVNGEITAIAFERSRYHAYSDTSLEDQISRLAKLVYVKRRRSRIEALHEATGKDKAVESRKPQSPKEEEFLAAQRELAIEIQSEHMLVRVIGGLNWAMKIRPGTVRNISESEFTEELTTLVQGTISEWRSAVRELRMKIFGISQITFAFKRRD